MAAELAERAKVNASAPRPAPQPPAPPQAVPASRHGRRPLKPNRHGRRHTAAEATAGSSPAPAAKPVELPNPPPAAEQPKPAPAQAQPRPVPANSPQTASPQIRRRSRTRTGCAAAVRAPQSAGQSSAATAEAAPPPPAQTPPAAPASPPHEAAAQDAGPAGGAVRAVLKRNGDSLSIAFPFTAPTPAAVFRRADMVWMVFDTDATVAISALNAEQGKAIRSATAKRAREVAIVQVKLERPQLISVAADGNGWIITLGNEVVEPTRPLLISRNIFASARSNVSIAIDEAKSVHRIDDPDIGDALYVITASAPARGFLKSQDFVEFRALASAHGIALQPLADDLNAELAADKVIVSRPGGLSLSAIEAKTSTQTLYQRNVIDLQAWGFDRAANFNERNVQLFLAAADAPEPKRLAARCDLARFYLSRDMFTEAKAVLDVTVADSPPTSEDSAGSCSAPSPIS